MAVFVHYTRRAAPLLAGVGAAVCLSLPGAVGAQPNYNFDEILRRQQEHERPYRECVATHQDEIRLFQVTHEVWELAQMRAKLTL